MLLLGRRFRPDERQRLFTLFNFTNFVVEALAKSKSFEDDYQFHKRLGQTLTLLGNHHLASLKSSSTKSFPPNYDTFLRLVLTFGTHPSIMLSSFSLPFWIQLLSDADVVRQPFFGAFIPELLKMCAEKLFKGGDLRVRHASSIELSDRIVSHTVHTRTVTRVHHIVLTQHARTQNSPPPLTQPANPTLAAFNSLDFDTRDALLQFFSTFRSKLQEVIRLIADIQPDQCLQFAIVNLRDAIPQQEGAPCTVHSMVYLRLESATTFLENALMGLPKTVFALTYPPMTAEQDAVSQQFAQLSLLTLQMLFNWNTKVRHTR